MIPYPYAPTAQEIMTKDIVTLDRKLGILAAAETLIQRGVSNAPVVTTVDGKPILVGFVSEKDVMQCYANGEFYRQPGLTVGDVMRVHPVGVKPKTDVFTLAAIFMQHEYRHVPVVESKVLLGMVSRRDVLRALLAHYYEWAKLDVAQRRAPDLESVFAHRYIVG